MGKRVNIKKTNTGSVITIDTSIMYQPKYIFIAGWLTGITTTYLLNKLNKYLSEKVVDRYFKKKK